MKFTGQKPSLALAKIIKQPIKVKQLEMNPEALIERDKAVAKAREVVTCNDASQLQLVRDNVIELRRRVKAVRESRKQITKPLDEARAQAIQIEDDYCLPLEAEIDRFQKLADEHQEQEDKRIAAAAQARTDELNRLDAERHAAEVKLESATGKQATKLEMIIEEAENNFSVAVRQDLPEASRAKGQTRRADVVVEIVDKAAAFAAMPFCFDVTPKQSVLKAHCVPAETATEQQPETKLYPGVKCYWKRSTVFTDR